MKKRDIRHYTHTDQQRLNNPPAGLVDQANDPDGAQKQYAFDPHLDPSLQWAGKAEHTSFSVPTVSLHVHERIESMRIISRLKQRDNSPQPQPLFFDSPAENPPLREAIGFYKHQQNWKNRLIAGDSLLVMNSLLEKEGMGGKVQMVYLDPPYGIKYGSNFQPYTNQRNVRDGKDEDLTREPEMIRAFRDTWELGIHSYLSYMRDRLILARELLSDSGSCFVQISDENVHLMRCLMDEVFGVENFVSLIAYASTSGFESTTLSRSGDYLVWYAKNKASIKFNSLFVEKIFGGRGSSAYSKIELSDGARMSIKQWEKLNKTQFNYDNKPRGSRVFSIDNLTSQGASREAQNFDFKGKTYMPKSGSHWKANYPDGMAQLSRLRRIEATKDYIGYVRYFDDFPMVSINNIWSDTLGQNQYGSEGKKYVVQTALSAVQRCLLMTTDPGDLVLDPTCGSGTTAYVAERWGRRWITCDTSRVALALAKQRLMTASFDYYYLQKEDEGIGSGFVYKTVPHVTLKSIANNPDIRAGMSKEEIEAAIRKHAPQETLYDQPKIDKSKVRVTGPFTVEAVPAPVVQPLDEIQNNSSDDASRVHSGATLQQSEWRDALLRSGVRGKGGQRIDFARLEPLPGTRYLHAEGETRSETPQRVVVSFGSEHAPLETRQVEAALGEANTLMPKPQLVLFAAFQFDPEAAKDIETTQWSGVTLLKVQMNADLLTEDLQKKGSNNDSFWLIGQPEVQLLKIDGGKWQVQVLGFDYFDLDSGRMISGSKHQIAMWMLDVDYDGRSLCPTQVFLPMAGAKDGWSKLARNLKAEINPELIEAYRGNISLPFKAGKHQRAAMKIIDDRGIESLKLIYLEV